MFIKQGPSDLSIASPSTSTSHQIYISIMLKNNTSFRTNNRTHIIDNGIITQHMGHGNQLLMSYLEDVRSHTPCTFIGSL